MTLQDVADLARVRRPVVSMWRKRPRVRGQHLPFPDPVEISGGMERFRRQDIVEWLERTGRGNNAEANLDAPALSVPDDVTMDELVTWLCLAALTGEELAETAPEQRKGLARGVDPDDQVLLREVEASIPAVCTLRFVDDLVEASYGPREALDRLEQGRAARALGTRDLTTDAVDLIHAVADACALHLDPEGVPLVHVGPASGMTLALAETFAHLMVSGDTPELRDIRRRAAIRGIQTVDDAAVPNVRLLSAIGRDADEILDLVDNLVLDLGEGELAVVIGPAGVLCDELQGERERHRAQTLRSESLVVALRLPRGMWREAHRQALGLWVCAAGGFTLRPLVADLAAFTRDELDLGDLASDMTGALAAAGGRAFRYLRPHDLPPILSSRAVVVPRGVRAVRLATTEIERHVAVVNTATMVTSQPIRPFDVLAEHAPGAMLLRRRSLGELKDLGQVRVLRGSRIDPAHDDPAGSVAVLSATGSNSTVRLDPFDAARLYPRAVRTDPGDVVFTERPRPTAFIDNDGGSLVASPSKILRIGSRAGIGPHTVMAIINRLADEVIEWQTWNLPVLDTAEAARLEDALVAAAHHEEVLRQHLGATRDLVTAMIDGVAAGAVTLTTRTTQ
ncbi:MAG: helix-turn-helix transcriptional regulator [Labedaea sp.]